MNRHAIDRARALALRLSEGRPFSAPADGRPRRFRIAVGDPQCPLEVLLEVLARGKLLTSAGRLRPEVQLLSVGDHFDWGGPEDRARAGREGLAILAWLSSHPADQVLLCAGNHDLCRVGDLFALDDAGFSALLAEADAQDPSDPGAEAAFLRRHPGMASSLLVRRDLSSFRAVQRDWVAHLLNRRRLRLAHAMGPSLLVTHAGVTLDEASVLGLSADRVTDAHAWARTLNLALDRSWRLRGGGPLVIPGLYRPGRAAEGEGVGVVYHRATLQPGPSGALGASPPRRRFFPRRLPRGLTQVIGHIRDHKSRVLLELPTHGARDGVLRHLVVRDRDLSYAHGPRPLAGADEAVVLYVDGSLRSCPPEDYELFDFSTLGAWKPGSRELPG